MLLGAVLSGSASFGGDFCLFFLELNWRRFQDRFPFSFPIKLFFTFFVASVITVYSKDRWEEGSDPLYFSKNKMCFDNHKKNSISNVIGNLLKHFSLK